MSTEADPKDAPLSVATERWLLAISGTCAAIFMLAAFFWR